MARSLWSNTRSRRGGDASTHGTHTFRRIGPVSSHRHAACRIIVWPPPSLDSSPIDLACWRTSLQPRTQNMQWRARVRSARVERRARVGTKASPWHRRVNAQTPPHMHALPTRRVAYLAASAPTPSCRSSTCSLLIRWNSAMMSSIDLTPCCALSRVRTLTVSSFSSCAPTTRM